MIILKILLYTLLGILGLLLTILILSLLLPINAEISFIDGVLKYSLKFSFIPLKDSDGNGLLRKKNRKPAPEADDYEDIPEFFPEDDIEDDVEDDTDTDGYDVPEDDDDTFSDTETDIDIPIVEDFEEYQENLSGDEEEAEEIYDTEPDTDKHEEKSLTDKIEFLINIWDIAGKPLLKIFRGFHVKKVYIDFVVAGDDPYKCALFYGTVSGTVYNILAWLGELFTVSYKTVDINCGFNVDKSKWDASCKVNFRLYTLVFSILWFLTGYLFRIYIPEKLERKKSRK